MARLTKPIESDDHTLGTPNAPVELVEYGDFQCPYCGAAFPVLQQVLQMMDNRLLFAFRNFPLSEAHEFAEVAAEAAESAGAQGKFWQMHNIIYQNQDQLDVDHLYRWANQIGLNMDRFDKDLAKHTYQDAVHDDFISGVRSGVNGTPTLFINGIRYDGPIELDALLETLNEAAETARA